MDFPDAISLTVRLLNLSPEQLVRLRSNVLENFEREQVADMVGFLDWMLESPETHVRLREDLRQFDAEIRYDTRTGPHRLHDTPVHARRPRDSSRSSGSRPSSQPSSDVRRDGSSPAPEHEPGR